jgi:hypothetical protein
MRALIPMFLAALLAGCCVGGYPPMWSADPAPFNAFQAGMKLAVGMPTDVAILIVGSRPVSSKATSCGVLAMRRPEIRLLRGQPAPCLYRADA